MVNDPLITMGARDVVHPMIKIIGFLTDGLYKIESVKKPVD